MRQNILIASVAILLGGSIAAQANTGFSCSFLGGAPGAADSEGNTGPFQVNGKEYKADGASIREASRAARQSCSSGESLGGQGCQLNGCTDLSSATLVVPKAGG